MRATIAIIGSGPAGSALACMLQQRGYRVIVYSDLKHIQLLVGESLLSAAVPILRRLGVEEQVAKIAPVKLGAGLRHTDGTRIDFRFPHYSNIKPGYAYNIPRPEFDNILRQRARQLGATVIDAKAKVERSDDNDRDVQLCEESLHLAGLSRSEQPEWLIDASGRARVISRCLNIPAKKGQRNDIAHFAHFKQFDAESAFDGQVLLTAMDYGWAWQIPLKNRTSVGVVIDNVKAKKFGNSPEERLERIIDSHPMLSKAGSERQRVSDVASYARYQLISERAFGKGWVLVGDALGFVDPMLSPGVFMALEAANTLDAMVFSRQEIRAEDLARYSENILDWHQAWQNLIEYFYNGKLLTLAATRQEILASGKRFTPQKLLEGIVSNALAGMTTGFKTRSKLSFNILKHSCEFIAKDKQLVASRAIRTLQPEMI